MKISLLALALAPTVAALRSTGDGDWTQYHGGETHNNERKGKLVIDNPEVAWHVPDAFGQPTLVGDDVYPGGMALLRIHTDTGEVLARVDVPTTQGLIVLQDGKGRMKGNVLRWAPKAD